MYKYGIDTWGASV